MKHYLLNLLIALDQNLNTLFGGYPDETVSLHAARARDLGSKWGCVMCKFLDLFQKGHCDKVIANEHASIIERKL